MIDPPPWLAARLAALHDGPHRTGSLIVTLFGDAVVPRGGELSVASLLAILGAMGIGEGVVRTAASRLAAEGWLERRRVGRHAFYRLAGRAEAAFAAASERIYGPPPSSEDGRLRLVLLTAEAEREAARAALEEAGFAPLAAGLFVAPFARPVPELAGLVRLEARPEAGQGALLARLAWPLDAIAERYRRFCASWEPALAEPGPAAPLPALLARILLIHDYRRVVLKDPWLPAELLPRDWPQPRARALCGRLWHRLLAPSEAWLDANATTEHGALPPAGPALRRRFGDLVAGPARASISYTP
ncbi:MAG: phenylacetic acid degradation operon negative regulatory protein PaaX [Geminicoccaceae bacterium]|nr:phenylacetic acid degradation operon negative regulatory protein PaaX [Geminicoccaceae bacterium]MCX8102001.1 phenylacetic acid degradation operon negative regulatory protein PaaX [Geminicoccaceae bacterium]MDW8369316.1 PaaX family transcriptional regulator C-terminal domain-containing protein [Geminicoccaceae bacterium]